MAYGYRPHEVGAPYGMYKSDVKIVIRRKIADAYRPPAMASLGCHVEGAAPPHADPSDEKAKAAGIVKRIAALTHIPCPRTLRKIRRWFRKEIRKTFRPLDKDIKIDLEHWLSLTHYPEWRKQEIRDECARFEGKIIPTIHYVVKCFMKDETYDELKKHLRCIFARHDRMKAFFGPWFKAIEDEVYKHQAFIKHVPVCDRPAYISNMLEGTNKIFLASDYTAYESHFIPEVMEAMEFELYEYMTAGVPGGKEFMETCRSVLAGTNICQFKDLTLKIKGTRMSGEMNTSLGNGFVNYFLMKYMCEEVAKCKHFAGVVEGDDGLFSMTGKPPSSSEFANAGFTIKLELHNKLETASFCGIIFDPVEKINVKDPIRALCNFGWCGTSYVNVGRKRRLELLRAKALSYAHQYPGCPVVQELAHYGLRMTRHVCLDRYLNRSRLLGTYERERLLNLVDKPVPWVEPGLNTRHLVFEKFGLSLEDQVSLEAYLRGLTSLQPLRHPALMDYVKDDYRKYWDKYVMPRPIDGDRPFLHVDIYRNQLEMYNDIIQLGWAPAHGMYHNPL